MKVSFPSSDDVQSGHAVPRLLYFFRGEASDGRPAFAAPLEAKGWQVDCVPVSDRARARGILNVFSGSHDFRGYDVVAASEYYLTWALCLRLCFRRSHPKLVALSFNQSSERLARTGYAAVDKLLNRVWRRVALFLVHSRDEARLFARLHDIPSERFVFSYWGYDLPHFAGHPTEDGAYVTMVGRNNRDLATFCTAVQRAGTRGVLITASYMLKRNPITPPDCVKLLVDRPMDECLNYVAGSFAHLVLVSDARRGAGHISAVSAMLLGKPQIFSDVAPIADYLIDGFNGIAVPLNDGDAVASAIQRLLDDTQLAARLGSAGRQFALESMSNNASSRRIAEAIIAAYQEDLLEAAA